MIADNQHLAKSLLRWYWAARRDLPWRPPLGAAPTIRPDAYHVLLSEVMLQQTQVATVIPYFHRFLAAFPTLSRLAQAHEQEVLRLWQGLGYYSRARNLHRAAQAIVAGHGGLIPRTVVELLELPGIGRYTAGAVASQAYDVPAAIVDCNVQRVICRLDAITQDPREKQVSQQVWQRSAELLPREHPGDFNSALMELGATVCTTTRPKCQACPVRPFCQAASMGIEQDIPPAKKVIRRPMEQRWVFCIEHNGRWLIEQRPAKGRWAGMWQFVTVPAGKGQPTPDHVEQVAGTPVAELERMGLVTHTLTHRRYRFTVWQCRAHDRPAMKTATAWTTLDGLAKYPLPKPHVVIASMLRQS